MNHHGSGRSRSPFSDRQEAARQRANAKKCGKRMRDGTPCEKPAPCYIHTLAPGKKWCSSTLDTEPLIQCGMQCEIGKLYCDKHKHLPDVGRKAATYYEMCMEDPDRYHLSRFMDWAYPHIGGDVEDVAHDFAKFAKNMFEVMVKGASE